MTLLHYSSKSGAAGIGDPELAADIVSMLLSKGADPNIRCRWTHMTPLHYAAYFDVVPVIKILLKATKALGKFVCVDNLHLSQQFFSHVGTIYVSKYSMQ